MNRGGHTNLNGAPVDHLAPVFDHLNTVEAMTAALDNPAFAAKWGNLLRAKHPVLARAYDNAKASRASGTHSISGIVDGNFMPRGMEQTPFDETTVVARGEQQRQTDPDTVAGLDAYLAGKDSTESETGGKGVKSDMGGAGKNERPRDIAPLVVNLAQFMARLHAAVTRHGGIRKRFEGNEEGSNLRGILGVQGLRGGMDARRKAADERIESARAFAKAIGDKGEVRTVWDASLLTNRLDTE